jgi:TRAP transporter TAXI family solute receptor
MRIRGLVLGSFLFALVAMLLPLPGPVRAQQLPRSVTMGTPPPGTLAYSQGSGLAKVVSGAAPLQMVVQPHSGTSTYLPLVNSGELEFGIVNAVDMGMAYQGPQRLKVGGRNPFPFSPNARLVMRGSPLFGSPIVRKDSGIRSIYDVKGKRMTGEYPAHLAVWFILFGSLANAGLTWDDVKVVPVPAVNDGIDALVQGRAEVSIHALGAAKLKEADASVGVRNIKLDCSPQGEERVKKAIPGWYLVSLKAGTYHTIVEETCVFAYDLYWITHKALPDVVVQAALKALWENTDKLLPLHPSFKDWTRERAVDPSVTIPYHSGAVQFYKQREVWKAEMDQAQQRLLAPNP